MPSKVYRFEHEAMTTLFSVMIAGHEPEYARQAADAVFREIDHLENLLSKHNAGSDVGQINLLEPGQSMRVGAEAIECLEAAAWAYHVTDGLFDPTLGSGFEWLKMDSNTFTAGWSAEGKGALDLGGLGKGYALDKVKPILNDWDVNEVLLNAGGSTALALGREWTAGVGGPWGEKAGLTEVRLKNQALSGSGTEVKGAHIVNPKTGKPATRHRAAWALHESAAKSDALSTAFMMMPKVKIEQLCRKHRGIVAFVVNQDDSLERISV